MAMVDMYTVPDPINPQHEIRLCRLKRMVERMPKFWVGYSATYARSVPQEVACHVSAFEHRPAAAAAQCR